LEVAKRVDVPVFIGADHPVGELPLSTRGAGGGKDFHGPYGFGANELPPPTIMARKDITAVEFIITSARKYPGKISVLIFSPPSTLALAVAACPSLSRDIKSVYMMGGALRAAGNTSPLAEANFANDAAASAQIVVAFSKKLFICPLDMTLTVLFSEPELERLKNKGGASAKWFVEHLAPFYTSTYRKITGHFGMPIHDAHTVTALTNPELYTMEYLPVEVLVGKPGEYAHGMLLSDRRGGAAENDANGVGSSPGIGNAYVLTQVDVAGFSNLWIDVVGSL
jgi:purine nucleosidase